MANAIEDFHASAVPGSYMRAENFPPPIGRANALARGWPFGVPLTFKVIMGVQFIRVCPLRQRAPIKGLRLDGMLKLAAFTQPPLKASNSLGRYSKGPRFGPFDGR